MASQREEKKEYLRKLDIRIRRWIRVTMINSSTEEQDKMTEDLLQEGEKLYDEVCIILNRKAV